MLQVARAMRTLCIAAPHGFEMHRFNPFGMLTHYETH